MTPTPDQVEVGRKERRRERILRICDELIEQGVPEYAVEPAIDYAEEIRYCTCGHEDAGAHGNGIVDRRCLESGCDCKRFTETSDLVLQDHNDKEAASDR